MGKKRNLLIAERKKRGWTQQDVAQKLGVTTSFYGMIEQGARNPRLSLALQIEKLFGIPLAVLFPELYCTHKPNETLCTQSTAASDDDIPSTGTDGP